MNDNSFISLFDQISGVVLSNKKIWIPVLAAWMLGFLYTKWMNTQPPRRQADKEFRVYSANAIFASIIYSGFNYSSGVEVFLPQATLAGAVAVLLPALWFWWQKKKT